MSSLSPPTARYMPSPETSCYVRELTYPGPMPPCPFIMDGAAIWMGNSAAGSTSVGSLATIDFRNEMGAQPASPILASVLKTERFPVLAFGANRNPSNLLWKLQVNRITGPVVGIPGVLRNAEVVVANVFYSGHFYADLLCAGDECADQVECLVLLLDREQLMAIHRSEEVPSEQDLICGAWRVGARPAWFDVAFGAPLAGLSIRAIGYASWSTAWSMASNRAVAFREVAARGRKLEAYSQPELFSHLCRRYFPDEESDQVLERFRKLWKDVRAGGRGYDEPWYQRLVDQISSDSVRGAAGERLTGIAIAEEQGRLLAPREVWRPLPSFAAGL